MEESKQPRPFQACTQCRSRKLKCIMDPVDGQCAPPCKRCRRESKQCTVPEPKRKRYNLESSASWTPAKRQQAKQSIEAASRPSSPVRRPSDPLAPARPVSDKTTSSLLAPRPTKRQRTMAEPAIAEPDAGEDCWIMSTAAPWALDFMPVTFCGTIADLSQAYGYQGPSSPSQATSPPSTADGDERQEIERAASPTSETAAFPQTVAMSELHSLETATTGGQMAVKCSESPGITDQSEAPAASNYGHDLGLDDIFNYIRFG
jgi:hypothetical protein